MVAKKRTWAYALGGVGAALLGIYWYQPQRIDLFPRPVPNPNPKIDPDSARLFARGARIAVVAAHPDDTEFFLGGTLARLAEGGADILIIVCTDGDKGYYPPFLTNADENRKVRREEQLAAAASYGARVVFLAEPDGRLRASDPVVSRVHQALSDFRPEYLVAFDPDYPLRVQHSDHTQAGIAGIRAADGVPSLRWQMLYSTHAPNFFVDVTAFWSLKERLLALHASQFHGPRFAQMKAVLKSWARSAGESAGFPLAEPFRVARIG